MTTRQKELQRWSFVLMVLVACLLWLPGCGWLTKPAMPVEITSRESVIGQGYVLQFHNTSTRLLRVAVSIKDSATGQIKEQSVEMPAGEKAEIGWLQGWKFVSGDQVIVRHEEYAEQQYRIP